MGAPASNPLTHPMSFRLTDVERDALKAVAASQGIGPATLVRRLAVEAGGLPLPPIAVKRDALALVVAKGIGELGRLGNVLNQLARVANARRTLGSDAAMVAFERAARELAAVRAALIVAEGEELHE